MAEYPIVDGHQHCWQLADTTWPTAELAAIYRDFTPDDFLAASGAEVGSVLVQSQPTDADTDYLLALAYAYPHILGVVGWVDLHRGDAPEMIARRAREPKFCGVRPMLQAIDNDQWILGEGLEPALQALERHRLSFDALILPRHLPAIEALAQRYPALPIVLDHAAKPNIAAGQWDDWYRAMDRLAARPNVYCKLSGLMTEAAAGESLAVTQPYLQAVLTLFGARRVIWGSDWPVLNLACNYADWLAFCSQQVKSIDAEAMRGIFCDNAKRFYCLSIS